MTSRKRLPPPYEEIAVPAPNFIRIGAPSGHRSMDHSDHVEDRLAIQALDLKQLAEDNRRLSATHLALNQDVVAAQQEVKKLTDHIRSIQAETDIQIRILLDKISKIEVDIGAGENVRKELQQSLAEARNLALARKELINQIQQGCQELEKTRSSIKKLPEMRAELDSLRKEHEKLRTTFEYEKGKNMEKVEKMRLTERELVSMAAEVERLRAEVLSAQQRAQAIPSNPYTGPYSQHPNALYPASMYGSGVYVDNYGRPLQMGAGPLSYGTIPYGAPAPANGPMVAVTTTAAGASGNTSWSGTYNASHAQG